MEVSVQCEQCKKACFEQNPTLNQNRSEKICSGRGELECGACKCNGKYEGKNCECAPDSNKEESCKENGEVCNHHGKCKCGKCKCDEHYLGKFCQHSMKEYCSLDDGKLVKKIFNILHPPAR